MDKSVTTIFLSMSLTVAFTRLVNFQNPSLGLWAVFLYFVFRKISYFIVDIRFSELYASLFRPGDIIERLFNLILGIATLFMFIATGYYVTQPTVFFRLNALTLLLNIGWLIILIILIDPAHDRNEKLQVRKMFTNFIYINVAEILICLVAGFWLKGQWSWQGVAFQEIESWILGLSLGILFFIMLIDFLMHKYFLFDPSYKCE